MPPAAAAADTLLRIWSAFSEFAIADVSGLYPGLVIPRNEGGGTDRIALETRLGGRPAGRNRPARPPTAWLSRRAYLVDDSGEWVRSDEASLRLTFPPATSTPKDVVHVGEGGPATGPNWVSEVELLPLWRDLREGWELAAWTLE